MTTPVAIVCPDLSHEETIIQITRSLDQINALSNQIFSNLNIKVRDYSSKLDSINQRYRLVCLHLNISVTNSIIAFMFDQSEDC